MVTAGESQGLQAWHSKSPIGHQRKRCWVLIISFLHEKNHRKSIDQVHSRSTSLALAHQRASARPRARARACHGPKATCRAAWIACSWDKTISSKKLLGAKGIATTNKDATRGSWPYY